MKKFINSVDTMLAESLDGFAAAHADIVALGAERKFVRRRTPNPDKVALISGGGSGHEPLHAGFVGHGMLDAACPGQMFTSPTPDQIVEAAAAVGGKAGVLFIVKNYAGDCMNFEMAAELCDGPTATVVTNDDVAVEKSTTAPAGAALPARWSWRRSSARPPRKAWISKPALSSAPRSMPGPRSMGVALTSCTVPAAGNADLHACRRRDGNGRGHPWRARTRAGEACGRRRHRRPDGHRNPERSRQSAVRATSCCSSTASAARRRSSSISCTTPRGAFWKSAG